jgi:8-oxo-dGTP pyrophosphatase MutT (NUDIX family)
MGKKKRIRPLAICVFCHNNRILVAEGYDSVKDQYFYRPLGGAIEFGEWSQDTICRELMEELNTEVVKESLKYLGALENIFHFDGTPSHEIILVYDGALKDPKLYDQASIIGSEVDMGKTFTALWKSIDDFGEGKAILYPTGLLEMLL